MTECGDCGEGPGITEHACWCETGHLALVCEVKRLRAALGIEPTQDSAPVGEITKRVRAEQAVLTVLRAKERAAGRAEMAAEVREWVSAAERLGTLAHNDAEFLLAKLPEAE